MNLRSLLFLMLSPVLITGRLCAQNDYFQQRVDYRIEVRLDPDRGQLHGRVRMTYRNQSPNVLTEIWMHLWPNAYKNRQTAWARQQLRNGKSAFHHSKRSERGFIDSLAFRIDGEFRRALPHPEHIDIVRLPLNKPLLPGDSAIITTPFRVQVPKSFSRLGRTGEQYQITQWYPKPAVFDRQGWHPMPYLDQGEFYSEFGTYDVSITVPEHYVVGSTGRLVNNPTEENFMKQREAQSRQLLVAGGAVKDKPFEVPAQPRTKTLRFVQEDIHDFAWFCDPQYLVLTEKMFLPSGRHVELLALFNHHGSDRAWSNATQYLREGVQYYSQIVGEYPYSRCTAVDGALSAGAGMEYPMITVVSANGGDEILRQTIIHEVGHNWFYGILASNERAHPWMDEGFNSYVEGRAMELVRQSEGTVPLGYGDGLRFQLLSVLMSRTGELGFAYSQGANLNQPLTLPADEYASLNYGLDVYMRMTLLIRYLENYLGREVIDRCLQTYYKDWFNRHPGPADIKASFEKASQQDLSWFFDELLPSADPVRIRLEQVRELETGKWEVVVNNQSGYRLPVRLVALGPQGDTLSQGWLPPFMGKSTTTILVKKRPRRIVAGHDHVLVEPNLQNNASGWATPALKLGTSISPRPNRRDFNWLPAYGYNSRDGNQLGAIFFFQPFPKRGFEFHVLPMYSLLREHWTGSAGFTLRANQFPYGHALRKVEFRSRGALFADLLRVKHAIDFYFASPRPNRPRTSILTLRTHQLGWREADGSLEVANNFKPYYIGADWHYADNRKIWAWGFDVHAGGRNADVLQVQLVPNASWEWAKDFRTSLRIFAAVWAQRKGVPPGIQYALSGGFDMFGERYYIDRRQFLPETEIVDLAPTQETGFWSRQLVGDQGGFRSLLFLPGTDRWMLAFNLSQSLPSNLFLFADYGLQPNARGRGLGYYGSGLGFKVVPDVLHINFPLLGSVYRDDIPQTWKQFGQQINFTLQLNEAIRRIPF